MSSFSFSSSSPNTEFSNQGMVVKPKPCTFLDSDISKLRLSGTFPPSAYFRPHDSRSRPDWYSERWICFPEYPFTIGLTFPFPALFNEFFSVTGLCYAQISPQIWRVLSVIQAVSDRYNFDFDMSELCYSFGLHRSVSNYFYLKTKPSREELVFDSTVDNKEWESKFFFVFRDSLPSGDLIPSTWVKKVKLTSLVPFCQQTAARIKSFLEVPRIERTFQALAPLSGDSMTGLERPARYFTLADIDADLPVDEAPKETVNPERKQAPKETAIPERKQAPKPPPKKRKLNRAPSVDKPHLSFETAFQTLREGVEHTMKCYLDVLQDIDAINEANKLKDAASAQDSQKIASLESEVKALKAKLSKTEKEKSISILETRITMAEEASSSNFNASSWRCDIWKQKLAVLKRQNP